MYGTWPFPGLISLPLYGLWPEITVNTVLYLGNICLQVLKYFVLRTSIIVQIFKHFVDSVHFLIHCAVLLLVGN